MNEILRTFANALPNTKNANTKEDAILQAILDLTQAVSKPPELTLIQQIYSPDELSPEEQYFKDKDLAQRLLNIR